MRLGALAWEVGRPLSLADFAARLDARIAEAAPRADLLLLPEYACMELAPALAREAGCAGELAAMVEAGEAVLAVMRAAAQRHSIRRAGGGEPRAAHSPRWRYGLSG